jgi:hypothetical protein
VEYSNAFKSELEELCDDGKKGDDVEYTSAFRSKLEELCDDNKVGDDVEYSNAFRSKLEELCDDHKVGDDDAKDGDDEGSVDPGEASYGEHDGSTAKARQQGLQYSRLSFIHIRRLKE